MKKFADRKDIYQSVTDVVINGIKEKGLAWFCPWKHTFDHPINNSSGTVYKGFNILWLSHVREHYGYKHNEWLTFKQCLALGGNVIKEESKNYTEVVYWNVSYKHKETNKYFPNAKKLKEAKVSAQDCFKFLSPRLFLVYNIEQCTNIKPRRNPGDKVSVFEEINKAEDIYNNFTQKPSLSFGGNKAYYRPATHHIRMPEKEKFVAQTSIDDYYKTLFHELVHSTGHKDVLNRSSLVKCNNFGSEEYSKEELVAEIGSQFLVGLTGINPKDNQANTQAYINGWLKKIGSDPRLVLQASQQAIKAVECILSKPQQRLF